MLIKTEIRSQASSYINTEIESGTISTEIRSQAKGRLHVAADIDGQLETAIHARGEEIKRKRACQEGSRPL